ncbi:glycoside hydrolase family 16 protein [Marinactinospora rubrisoli]|uniref:Glycoside hydrolase family 16 protein n=1 Tax=Marinactinospora rubrisoli TaxID=2715399 RepID=A0ABW2KBU3_9ACTN
MATRCPAPVPVLLVTALTATLAGCAVPEAGTVSATAADAPLASCGVFFDDFAYSGGDDPELAGHGWNVRDYQGGPGVPGAGWTADAVRFPNGQDATLLRLHAATDGTPAGTTQAELAFGERKFFEGTYAARVRFTDAPVTGPDGDRLVQTFFTITPLAADNDPAYSELDFEYLPNGGWGETGPALFFTSWETYQREPWQADNTHDVARGSFDGWHDLVVQVSGGTVRYHVDGELVAEHGGRYYPDSPMSINFNQWFIDLDAHSGGGRSEYTQDVDYVYYAGDEVLSPAEVGDRVAAQRAAGTERTDTVDGCAG